MLDKAAELQHDASAVAHNAEEQVKEVAHDAQEQVKEIAHHVQGKIDCFLTKTSI